VAEAGTDILKARMLLESGALVGIPTETVYGLAGNALNADAVAKIFEVKNRPQFDPLIIHVPNLQHVEQYVTTLPEKARLLAEAFWPGPLTLVLKKKAVIPDLVSAGLDTVGIRCPDHALTRALLEALNFPLAAPSANPFGYISPTSAKHVDSQLGDKIAYILDGGECRVGIESTIIGFEDSGPVIYRLGGLTLESIETLIGGVSLQPYSTSNPKSPGQLISHYAPARPLIVGDIEKLLLQHETQRVGIISFQRTYGDHPQIILSPAGSLNEAAKNLFAALRKMDGMNVDLILTELVPDTGLGRAINDRLKRASKEL